MDIPTRASVSPVSDSSAHSLTTEAVVNVLPQGEDMEVGDFNESTSHVPSQSTMTTLAASLPAFKKAKTCTTAAERIAEAKAIFQKLRDEREQHHQMVLQVISDAILQGALSMSPEERSRMRAREQEQLTRTRTEIALVERRIAAVVDTIKALEEPAPWANEQISSAPCTNQSTDSKSSTGGTTKLVIDNSTPHFGPKHLGTGKPYKVIDSPLFFLDSFQSNCKNMLGPDFQTSCHRLLIMATLEDISRQRLDHDLHKIPADEMSWEKCEECFADFTLTHAQREIDLNKAIEAGRRHGESYLNYMHRLRRIIRIYKVDVHDKKDMEAIFNTVPSVIVALIETRLLARNSNETRLTSLATFCEELALIRGPDDAIAKVPSTVEQHHYKL
ncbi:hypothetical protein BGZ51_007770 [Haplosporangium sp. Z 767]|nr:hypothetical protein BGZ51_007770 [Haplosporangium sp. Z 767]